MTNYAASWMQMVRGDPLTWLLEKDADNPGPRFFALTDLCDVSVSSPQATDARKALMQRGPVPVILKAQEPEGFWVKPGPGYNPKYKSTVWSLISLAQLGANPDDERTHRAGEYFLTHALTSTGIISMTGTLSGAIYCLDGNLIASLLDLGWWGDPRLEIAIEWLARMTTGEGMGSSSDKQASPRYLKSGICGPVFACSANNKLPCAWGGIKTMKAFARIPPDDRSPMVRKAIEVGVDFFFSRDPAQADYPMGWNEKPSRNWWKFGYPMFYISDMLEIIEVFSALGYGEDLRLEAAYQLLLDKQDEEGRWPLEYSYNGKTWVNVEEKRKPSKWVTLRALRALKNRGKQN